MHSCLDYRIFTSQSFSFSRRNNERHGAALYSKCSPDMESKCSVTEATGTLFLCSHPVEPSHSVCKPLLDYAPFLVKVWTAIFFVY